MPNARNSGVTWVTEQHMSEGSSPANLEAEQRKVGHEAIDSYKINGAAAIICLVALWWDASGIGAATFLAMIVLYNFGMLWYTKSRLDRAHDREADGRLPAELNLVHENET
jgi:hypothetical protein